MPLPVPLADPSALMYAQFHDWTRRFYPQFLSLLPASLPVPQSPAPTQAAAVNPGNIVFVEGSAGAAARSASASTAAA